MLFSPQRFEPWGRIGAGVFPTASPRFDFELPEILKGRHSFLAVGLGRSYGDSALNPGGALVRMTGLDRLLAFDPAARTIRVQAGMTFSEILRFLVPRRFFLPTTPGTRFVTVGGALANDVHGKNHHAAGTFGSAVRAFGLYRSNGDYHELFRDDASGLFAATIGGLGLTGIVSWVEFDISRIGSAWLIEEQIPFATLDQYFEIVSESESDWPISAAWIDCTSPAGRGLFSRSHFLDDGAFDIHGDGSLAVPFDMPASLLNGLTLRLFNEIYYTFGRAKRSARRVHYASAYYPLDSIRFWNRLYGSRGFRQYQSVVPASAAKEATLAMLRTVARSGTGSLLAVIKTFGGRKSPGMLSFPIEYGVTLALDFRNTGEKVVLLFAELDAIVRQSGGRLYAAKDGRLPAAMFQSGYPRWRDFKCYVDERFSSSFWRRVSVE